MIQVQNLYKNFANLSVLNGIDMQVRSGEVVCIIGPSGSGKSTLLRCLNLLENPTHGKIRIGKVELVFGDGKVEERMKRELRNKTGMVFQNFHLFPHKTVLENVIEGPLIVKKEPMHRLIPKAESLLRKVGLLEKRGVYPDQLSGGQQQRVAIARAMAMEPEVLLLDEPTSALDPELIGEVLSTIRELVHERQTMIIVTHEMTFAQDVADRIIFMDDGKIIETGKPDEIFQNPSEERTRQFLAKFIGS